jgi:hypothetical protein
MRTSLEVLGLLALTLPLAATASCTVTAPFCSAGTPECESIDAASESSLEAGLDGAPRDSSGLPDGTGDGPSTSDAGSPDGADAGCTVPKSLDCGGICVDPTLPAHCGSCTNICEGPDAGAGMATCTNGTCGLGCAAPTSLNCSGSCVDPSQPATCGSCTNVCPGPTAGTGAAQCTLDADGGGVCSVQCSGSTTQLCGTSCYALNDVNHCGSCSNACPVPTNGSATCTGATPACGITCSSGYHACNTVDCEPNTDLPSNTSDPCILSAQFGVFVATSGANVAGNGTPTAPFATVSFALAHLGGTSRVYVCNGSYNDAISVTAPVGIYGGLSCAGGTWAYTGGKATVTSTSTTGGPALTISNVSGLVQVQDMAFASQNAIGQGASGYGLSSIAVLVSSSSNVSFARSTLTAGSGAGALQTPPAMPSNYTDGPIAPGGSANSTTTGGTGGTAVCTTSGTSHGGAGGTVGTMTTETGGTGTSTPAATIAPTGYDGVGYPPTGIGKGVGGDNGASGTAGSPGSPASSYGSWNATPSWVPSAGGVGAIGDPGQGGGGGSAETFGASVGGTGGGAGGCGGAGGLGGAGGGASIALASIASTVSLDSGCTLTTSAGGAGQPGGPAEPGQAGGGFGIGAVPGGEGGNGGAGGGGAGGTGGLSVCIVYTSPEPTSSAGCTSGGAGQPGAGGAGAAGGNNMDGTPGGSSGAGSPGLDGTTTSPLLVP